MSTYTIDLRKLSPPSENSRQDFHYDSNNNDPNFYHSRTVEDNSRQTHVYSDPQRTGPGRTISSGHVSIREDTIEMARRSLPHGGPRRAELSESPLNLTTHNSGRELTGVGSVNDRTFPMSGNPSFRHQDTTGHDLAFEREATPLSLFVNHGSSRLDTRGSTQHQHLFYLRDDISGNNPFDGLSLNHLKRQLCNGSEESRPRDGRAVSEVGPTLWQKNSIVRLKRHLEKRQESRPFTDIRGAEGQNEHTGRNPEFCENALYREVVNNIQQRYNSSRQEPLSVEFAQEINDNYRRPFAQKSSYFENGLQSDTASRTDLNTHSMEGSIQQILFAAQPALHQALQLEESPSTTRPSNSTDGVVGPTSGVTQSQSTGCREASLHHRLSPDSRSLPEFETRRTQIGQSGLPSRRSVSTSGKSVQTNDDGLSMGKDRILTISNPKTRESVPDVESEMPESSCSPDQSTDFVTYKTGNIPSIVASARLSDFDFALSTVTETAFEGEDKGNQPGPPSDSSTLGQRRILMQLQMVMAANGNGGDGGKRTALEQPTSTLDEDPEAKVKDGGVLNENSRSSDSSIPCKVCQDVANGFHYGVWSCEGCKAFFKRSITGSARYVCPADNNCTINRLRKKSCQACRLRKCYEFGMSPGNCRGEHGSKHGRKRKFKEAHLDRGGETHENAKQSYFDEWKMVNVRLSGGVREEGADHITGPSTYLSPSMKPGIFQRSPALRNDQGGKILDHLVTIERPLRYADCDEMVTFVSGSSSSSFKVIASLMKLVNAQVLDIVKWSLDLPGFKELDINVRTQMLVGSWSEILLLTNAFHSLQTPNAFVMAPNFHLTREMCEAIGLMSLYNRLRRIVAMVQRIELTHSQLLLLQVITLINSDSVLPGMFPLLEELRANLLSALNEVPAERMPDPAASSGLAGSYNDRTSQLLLMLPHLKHCSVQFLGVLGELNKDTRVPVYSLLQDVIDNRRELDRIFEINNDDEQRHALIK